MLLLLPVSSVVVVVAVCQLVVLSCPGCALAKAVPRANQLESGEARGRHRDNRRPATAQGGAGAGASPDQGLSNVVAAQQKEQALGELLRAFGLENNTLEEPGRHLDPPPFMLDLYSSVADPASGRMRTPRPFNANTVRSLPDKGKHRLHFQFNLSHVPSSEMLLQAELHLFKLKPKMRPTVSTSGKRQPFYQIQLYQLASEDPSSLEGAKLIGLRLVGSVGTEWEVFSITDAVSSWLMDERTNHGVLVTITSLTGQPLDDKFIRFAQQGKHHPTKHPFLVLYTRDLRQMDGAARAHQDAAESAYETFFETYGNLNAPPFIDTTQAGPTPNVRTNRHGVAPEAAASSPTRQARSAGGPATSRQRRAGRQDPGNSAPTPEADSLVAPQSPASRKAAKGTCARKSMYVDFHEIGWSDWIIYPVGYNAYECQGKCPFPLGQTVQPSNHATVQSLMHLISADVAAPCCVPSQLDPIVVLFFDSDSNVVLKQFDNMVAMACGCR